MRIVSTLLLSSLAIVSFADQKPAPIKAAQSIPELRQQIEKILADTHTPGASVAIIHRDGPEWIAGIGKADIASGRDATAQTLFRIGSTSKAFASMSILKLVDQGKLSLDDPIHKLVPDVWFDNRWEATDPVRVVNLLEHTTGWDDMHLREYAKDAPGWGLREALAYGRKSRVSRWPPGTRMAYCNTGPAVAAYIVERITGQRFEDYVRENLFVPIGMKTATYFAGPAQSMTTLYHDDGKTPEPYWNIIYRPAGAINASAEDMAAYVQFYLNRGMVNGAQVIPSADIDRMESPRASWAAKDGLKSGYGLSNYWSFQDGFAYHGHNGGVNGGLTDMSYMPEYGLGYFFSINTGNGQAFDRIGKTIRAYITRTLTRPPVPAVAPLPPDASGYAGFYEPDSPRVEMTHFLERLGGLARFHFRDGKMLLTGLGGTQTFLPVLGHQFRFVPKDGPAEPAASVILIAPNTEGRFIQAGSTYKRIATGVAVLEIGLTAFVFLAMISVLLYAPVWLIGGLFKKRRRAQERAMRLWPLVAVLSLLGLAGVFSLAASDLLGRLGNITPWSVAIFVTSLMFGIASLAALWSVWRARDQAVRRPVRIYSAIVASALVIATLYLAYWGVIGLRTWS